MRYHVGIGCSFGVPDHNSHQILAKKLGARFINLSEGNRGNFRMVTELLYWISTNKEKLQQTTFSIGWSGIYRNDLIQRARQNEMAFDWQVWRADRDDTTGREMSKNMDVELDHTIRFLTNILSTQLFLKSEGCRYVMYNGIDTYIDRSKFDTHTALRIKLLEKKIDKTKFFQFTNSHSQFVADHKYFLDPTPTSFIKKITNWPSDDAQYPVKDAHPSAEGDEKWADMIWNFCQKNQLL